MTMRHRQGASIMLASPLATLLLTAGGMAVAAQVGLVKEVEVEYEGQ